MAMVCDIDAFCKRFVTWTTDIYRAFRSWRTRC